MQGGTTIYLFCKKNRFLDQLADTSGCDNATRLGGGGLRWGSAPNPLHRFAIRAHHVFPKLWPGSASAGTHVNRPKPRVDSSKRVFCTMAYAYVV